MQNQFKLLSNKSFLYTTLNGCGYSYSGIVPSIAVHRSGVLVMIEVLILGAYFSVVGITKIETKNPPEFWRVFLSSKA